MQLVSSLWLNIWRVHGQATARVFMLARVEITFAGRQVWHMHRHNKLTATASTLYSVFFKF
jgi:hypothetical protein